MCGIGGYIGDFSPDLLERMNEVMHHRGPDDSGTYFKGNIGLAHRRLSIIDISTGHQPMSNEDNTVWIAYNGEIYNYRTLRKQYLHDHTFRTRSDTEVILHLYEEFGEKCVEYLRGMFAFAIWDEKKKTMMVARDRFGIKPLYYAHTEKGFVFASELKALLTVNEVPRKVSKEAMSLYLTFRYVPGSLTMLEGFQKLEPAQYMVYKCGHATIKQYWDLDFEKDSSRSMEYYSSGLTELLRESIDIRLMSEVPLGAYLSGGLDSSFMVGLMSQLVSDPIKTFTAGFDGGWHDESPFAEIIAKKFNTEHRLLRANANASEVLKKVVWHLDEPLADAATIPTYLLSELTKQYVTVILSGEGADELLAGYDKYKLLFSKERFVPAFMGPFFSMLSKIFKSNIKLSRGLGLLGSGNEKARTYLDLVSVFTDSEKQELLGPELACLKNRSDVPIEIANRYLNDSKHYDFLDALMYLDIKTWLPNDVLQKNDKMTMAHSLEARVPFLDHKFAEFVVKIPNSLKLKGLSEKYILRKSMESLIPPEIVRRKKHGFTVPIYEWMQKELVGFVADLLSEARIKEKGFWNPQYIKRMLSYDLKNVFYSRQFWTIVTFEIWYRIFIEGERPH